MPGATFGRLKNWTAETLTFADLNAEINNILNNLNTSGVDDYSTNTTQMRLQTDPGGVGTEVLATSLAGEIERLRFVIKRIIGEDVNYWYEASDTSLSDLGDVLGTSLSSNRIVTTATATSSSQPLALIPNGSAQTLALNGDPDAFSYLVNGELYTIDEDISITGLSAAPSSNNTATVNMPILSTTDPQSSQWLGQFGTTIVVDAMGSEISNRIGQLAAFSIAGATTEYFIAQIISATELRIASRGYFFNSSGSHVPPTGFSDNDTITLLRLTWVFATTDGALAVSYNPPTYSGTAPSAPSTGDYWFDFVNDTWKTYNSTAWVASNSTLIGLCAQTASACVAARTFDPFVGTSIGNTSTLARQSNSVVTMESPQAQVEVYGAAIKMGTGRVLWDMSLHLDSGLTEAASTYYFFYLTESGNPVISTMAPLHRPELKGFYHPRDTWRCLGFGFNDASSNLASEVKSFRDQFNEKLLVGDEFLAMGYTATSSSNRLIAWPGKFYQTIGPNSGIQESGGSNTWIDALSIASVPPGVYRATGSIGYITTAGTITATNVFIGISTTSGNSTTDLVENVNLFGAYMGTESGQDINLVIPGYIMVLRTTSTVYLKRMATTTGANLEYLDNEYLQLERIDSINQGSGF